MRRTLLAALFAVGFAATASAADYPVDQLSLPVPRDREVRVDFPVGGLRVEATDDARVTFDVIARCRSWNRRHCEDRIRRIQVESDEVAGELRITVKGYPKMNSGNLSLRGVLKLPRDLALKVSMGVGELEIRDVEGDMDVDLGVGEASIHTTDRAVRSVDVSTGVGDADVYARGGHVRRHGFISSTASWDEGRGHQSINLSVGVGEGRVRVN